MSIFCIIGMHDWCEIRVNDECQSKCCMRCGRQVEEDMKTVGYKFFIDDIVKVTELGLKGRVISVWSGRRGNEIQVRLFINGKAEEIYFYEDELTEVATADDNHTKRIRND